jgi:MFS family permease
MSQVSAQTPSTNTQTSTSPRGLLAVLLPGVFVAILDVAIANVALPKIQTSMHATGAQLQLVLGGYIIAYAVLLITGARLGDLFGRRRMYLTGVAVFTLASLLSGLAWSIIPLIAFRLAQGAGAALMVPQVLSLIQLGFTGEERAHALGKYAAVIAGGAIAGQILGGVLMWANLFGTQWRLAFLVNVPIGAWLLLAGPRALPRDQGNPSRKLDLPGVVLMSLAVFALVLPLTLGHQLNWPAWTWASLAGCVVLAVLFVLVERRAERADGSPLIHGRLLRAPGMAAGALGILVAMGNYGGILFLLTLHVQDGLGHSPLVAGLVFLPSAVAFGTASLNWRKIPARFHHRMIPGGLLVSTLAFLGLALSVRHGDISVGMEVAILFFGGGMGLAFSPMFAFAMAHVPPANAADASGVLSTVNQLGQVIGVAGFGTVYLTSVAGHPGNSGHSAMITALLMAAGGLLATVITLALPPATK